MSNTTKTGVIFRGLVTDEQYAIIMEYYAEVGTVFSLIGIISNIINIRTFIVMGLSDGITVSFLALAIFDLSYLIVSLALGISVSFGVTELRTATRFPIDPPSVSIMLANIMYLLQVNNVLLTTFLAIARCMCVAKPLQFKNSFTRRRTIYVVTGFTIFAVVSYTPVLANMGIVPQFDKMTNSTRPILWVSTNREVIKVIVYMVIDMVLPCTTQVIIVICIIIMASSLRVASRFRQSSVMTSEKVSDKGSERNTSSEKDKGASSGVVNHSTNKLSGKDLRVVQQVILISLVYVICNTPKILFSTVGAIEPEFSIGRRYNNLYLSVGVLRKHFEAFNAAINTVIYYRYNTKFRTSIRC